MNRRLRLGLIAHEYPPLVGGMATYARAVASHMSRAGYEVHVFANRQAERSEFVHPILTTDLVRDGLALMRFNMDLWHSANFGYVPLALMKRPFVLTVHGTDFLTPWVQPTMDRLPLLWRISKVLCQRSARRALCAPAFRCVDQVVTCSRFSAETLRKEYPSVGPVQIVPNGVDGFFVEPDCGANRMRGRLLTVANLDTANLRKNVDGVIRAMSQVGVELDLTYHIIGDGAGRADLEALARSLGIADRVHFLGRVDDETLRREYVSASLFVLVPKPRQGDVEGFGIVYLEAAGQGTPSLASRYGGAVDAVADGVSGFFADDPTPAGIADALRRFFTARIRFNEQAVRDHAKRLTWPAVLRQLEHTYARCLASRSPQVRPKWSYNSGIPAT